MGTALLDRICELAKAHFVSESGGMKASELADLLRLTGLEADEAPSVKAALEASGVRLYADDVAPLAVKKAVSKRTPPSVAEAALVLRSLHGEQPRLLTTAEEVALGAIVQAAAAAGDTAAPELAQLAQLARREFELRNLRLVHWVAHRHRNQGLDYEDLSQEGWFGLRRAVELFDPAAGFKFSTYATWWIRQAIQRAIANQSRTIRLPVHVVDDLRKVVQVRNAILMEKGSASPAAVAARMGRPVDNVERLLRLARGPVSMDSPLGDGLNVLADLLPDPWDFEERVLDEVSQRELRLVLETLSDRERVVLELRHGLSGQQPMTLDQIGAMFDLTRERIRQIEKMAVESIRSSPQRLRHLAEAF